MLFVRICTVIGISFLIFIASLILSFVINGLNVKGYNDVDQNDMWFWACVFNAVGFGTCLSMLIF